MSGSHPQQIENIVVENYNSLEGVYLESAGASNVAYSDFEISAQLTPVDALSKELSDVVFDAERVNRIVSTIFEYLMKHKEIIEEDKLFKKANIPYTSDEELVKDYVAHLTDSEAISLHKKITYGKLNYI